MKSWTTLTWGITLIPDLLFLLQTKAPKQWIIQQTLQFLGRFYHRIERLSELFPQVSNKQNNSCSWYDRTYLPNARMRTMARPCTGRNKRNGNKVRVYLIDDESRNATGVGGGDVFNSHFLISVYCVRWCVTWWCFLNHDQRTSWTLVKVGPLEFGWLLLKRASIYGSATMR